MSPELELQLGRLQHLLTSSGVSFSPNDGATAVQIEEVEREIGFSFDADLRALYLFANGAKGDWFAGHFYDDALYNFRSLDRCVLAWRDSFPYDDPDWRVPGQVWDARIQPELLFHCRWFPFAEWNGFACCLHFDADPTPAGKYGQIIAADHDPDTVYYAAPSLADFMRQSNDFLSANPGLLKKDA
jgi:cell wall assembly regulator SMI1